MIEYETFGETPVLIVAPHEGTGTTEVEGKPLRVGEPGTARLARLAAKHVDGSCLVSRVPRLEADFARDPALLGKGAKFRLGRPGKRLVLTGHRDVRHSGLLKQFHDTILQCNPRFIIDFHRMSNRDADIRLGFGADRRYIGGTGKALQFRGQLVKRLSAKGVSLEVLVSKTRLTGESDFILSKHHQGRLAALVEFAARGFPRDARYDEAAKSVAETAEEWVR